MSAANLKVDFNNTVGKIKPIHGWNCAPYIGGKTDAAAVIITDRDFYYTLFDKAISNNVLRMKPYSMAEIRIVF